jgi:hypothetical protein
MTAAKTPKRKPDVPAAWRVTYKAVLAYARKHGALPAQRAQDWRVHRLGVWCRNQRLALDGRGGLRKLTEAQVELLDAIPGWWWTAEDRAAAGYLPAWKATYDTVLAHAAAAGALPTESAKDDDVKRLGVWCANQRRARTGKGTTAVLSPRQVELLDAVDGWWWSPAEPRTRRRAEDVATGSGL